MDLSRGLGDVYKRQVYYYGVIVISSQSKEPKVPTAPLLQLEYSKIGSAKGFPVSSKNLLYDSAYPLSNTQKAPSAP
jgi:hypothetical protein